MTFVFAGLQLTVTRAPRPADVAQAEKEFQWQSRLGQLECQRERAMYLTELGGFLQNGQ